MRRHIAVLLATYVLTAPAVGEVMEFIQRSAWESAAGPYATIDFTGYHDGLVITNQYEHLGVTFTGALQFIAICGCYANDGAGLYALPYARMVFESPQNWIAVEFPGSVRFNLYYSGELIHTSQVFHDFFSYFAGVISSKPFDEVIIDYPSPEINSVGIDDLFFGSPIPAPGALGAFALAALIARRGRRRG
jgi:hypothetical protein